MSAGGSPDPSLIGEMLEGRPDRAALSLWGEECFQLAVQKLREQLADLFGVECLGQSQIGKPRPRATRY